jgi:hypothetical protein
MYFKIKIKKSDDTTEEKIVEASDPVQLQEIVSAEYPNWKNLICSSVVETPKE